MLHRESFSIFENKFYTVFKRILVADKRNLNNRYYSLESLHKMVFDYNKEVQRMGSFYGVFSDSADFYEYKDGTLNIRDIAFTVDSLNVFGSSLIAKINILETPRGNDLKRELDKVKFRPVSWGFVKEDGKVEIERLVSINAIYKEVDSFQ